MVIVKAIFDYNGLEDHKIRFARGDIFELVDDADPNWWHVILPRSGGHDVPEHIYVPATYVAKVAIHKPNGSIDVGLNHKYAGTFCFVNDRYNIFE